MWNFRRPLSKWVDRFIPAENGRKSLDLAENPHVHSSIAVGAEMRPGASPGVLTDPSWSLCRGAAVVRGSKVFVTRYFAAALDLREKRAPKD